MEVSGRRVGGPHELGSQSRYEFFCQPCDNDGIHLEAEGFCETCDEFLCCACYKVHTKPTALRNHVLLDKEQMPRNKLCSSLDSRSNPIVFACTEICSEHVRETIKYFCPVHDQIGCSECLRQSHRGCVGVLYIPEVAGATGHVQEYTRLTKQVNDFVKSMDAMAKDIEQTTEIVQQHEDYAVTEIENFQEKVTLLIERLANAMKRKVNAKKNETDTVLEGQYSALEAMRVDTNKLTADLSAKYQSNSKGDLFVAVKNGQQLVKNFTRKMDEMKGKHLHHDFDFHGNDRIVHLLEHEEFGALVDSPDQQEAHGLSVVTDQDTLVPIVDKQPDLENSAQNILMNQPGSQNRNGSSHTSQSSESVGNSVIVRETGEEDKVKIDKAKLQRLYGKYLRAESFRKALIYQKKYLQLLLSTCESATETDSASQSNSGTLNKPRLQPWKRFQATVRVVTAIARMRYLVKKWRRVTVG